MDPMLIAYLATQLGGNIAGEYDKSGNKTFAAGARDAYTPFYQASQFQNMMQKWLGGGASIKLDKDTFKLDMPTTAFSQGLGGAISNTLTNTPSGISSPDLQKAVMAASPNTGPSDSVQTGNGGMQSALPFLFKSMLGGSDLGPSNSLPEIPLTGLVGLTPDHLAQVMKMKMMQQELGQKQQQINAANLNNLLDYNSQMAKYNQQAPISIPGRGQVSLEEWKSMPEDVRAYSYYDYYSRARGEQPIGFNEWKHQLNPTTIKQIYDEAMNDPEFMDFYFKAKEAGATKVQIDPYTRAKETTLGKSAGDVLTPGYVDSIVDRFKKQGNGRIVSYDEVKNYADEEKIDISSDEGYNRAKREWTILKILDAWDSDIKSHEPSAEFRADGWYVGDKRIVRNPYYSGKGK